MSDLQCPATFLVLASGRGVEGSALRGSRLAAVYALPVDDAVAAEVAEAAGLRVSPLEAAGGASYRPVLAALADVHRGETVAVVLPDAAVAGLTAAAGPPSPGDGALEVAIDGDGWSVRRRRDVP